MKKSNNNYATKTKNTKKKTGVYKISVNGKTYKVEVYDKSSDTEKQLIVVVNGDSYDIEVNEISGNRIIVPVAFPPVKKIHKKAVLRKNLIEPAINISREGIVTAPMPGKIIKVNVNVGDKAKAGDVLLSLEAMKMENEIKSPKTGIVKEVNVSEGMTVESKTIMVVIE